MKIISIAFIVFLSISYLYAQEEWESYPFQNGELLEYKLNYGWFAIGKASFKIESDAFVYDDEDCFNIQIQGGSSGFLNVFTKVNDKWGAYLKKKDLKPLYTYRDIEEGRYRLEEEVFIDHLNGSIRVEQFKAHRDIPRRPSKYYEFSPEEVDLYDMISGLMKVRNMPLSQFSEGDTIFVDGFFEDTFYNFSIYYAGKNKVKTKVGKFIAHKLIPVMPQNSTFDGKNSLELYFSDDLNQIPVKVTANMFIGKASCEIVSYQNLKYGSNSN